MRARAAFTLSLLAALGIHAVILLVPRAAFVRETKALPTILIDLAETPAIMAMSAAGGPAPLRLRSMPRAAPVAVTPPPLQPVPAPEPPAAPPSEPPAETAALRPADAAPSLVPEPRGGPEAAADAAMVPPAGPAPIPDTRAGPGAGSPGGPASADSAGFSTGLAGPGADSGSGLVVPRPLKAILPAYPRAARQSGAQGLVKVTATVDERGAVTGVEVLLSSGTTALDRAALEAVRRTAFTPALQGGKPVPCRITIPIRFQLSEPGR